MTNLEVCKRIAEIEGFEWFELDNRKHSKKPDAHAIYLNKSENGTYKNRYNPLTDAINLKLRDKYYVEITYDGYCRIFDEIHACAIVEIEWADIKDISKTVLLCIIESKKD